LPAILTAGCTTTTGAADLKENRVPTVDGLACMMTLTSGIFTATEAGATSASDPPASPTVLATEAFC
jgi:hypothetical protein